MIAPVGLLKLTMLIPLVGGIPLPVPNRRAKAAGANGRRLEVGPGRSEAITAQVVGDVGLGVGVDVGHRDGRHGEREVRGMQQVGLWQPAGRTDLRQRFIGQCGQRGGAQQTFCCQRRSARHLRWHLMNANTGAAASDDDSAAQG